MGLALIGASGIVSAMMPNKSINKIEDADDATLTNEFDTTNTNLTCVPDDTGNFVSCNLTIDTATTEGDGGNSFVDLDGNGTDQTDGNTSVTYGNSATSIVD